MEQKINNSLREQIAKRETKSVVAGDRSEIMSVVQKALEEAWKRNLIIISSNFSDVKKGVLLSVFPNNEATGKQLAKSLKKIQNNI